MRDNFIAKTAEAIAQQKALLTMCNLLNMCGKTWTTFPDPDSVASFVENFEKELLGRPNDFLFVLTLREDKCGQMLPEISVVRNTSDEEDRIICKMTLYEIRDLSQYHRNSQNLVVTFFETNEANPKQVVSFDPQENDPQTSINAISEYITILEALAETGYDNSSHTNSEN